MTRGFAKLGNLRKLFVALQLHSFNHPDAGSVIVEPSKAVRKCGWDTRGTRIGRMNTTNPEEHQKTVTDKVQEDLKSPGVGNEKKVETIRRNTEDNRL